MILKEEKSIRIIRGNVRQVVQPLHVVLQAVKELEDGELSIGQAMQKYDVKRMTIKNWLKKHSPKFALAPLKRASAVLKRKAVREIEAGLRSRKETAQKYSVDYTTVIQWVRQYSCKVNPSLNKQESQMQNAVSLPLVSQENKFLKAAIKNL